RCWEAKPSDACQSLAHAICGLRDRSNIATPLEFVESDAFNIAHQRKGWTPIQSSRFGMDHLWSWDRVFNQMEQVDFFAAKGGVVFIDTKHNECWRCAEPKLEICITEPIGQRLYVHHFVIRKNCADHLIEKPCGKYEARPRTKPARFNW